MIKAKNIGFCYPQGKRSIFTGIDFSLNPGEILAILGPNGSGKTTLIKVLLGLLSVQEGSINISGHCSYVPQSTLSPFDYSVKEMVVMGASGQNGLFAIPCKEDYTRTQTALEQVGMVDVINNSFSHLSGGQKQLVLIARALVSRPEVMILDEPTSSLDYQKQNRVLEIMSDVAREGKIVIFSTHCPLQALHVSHKALLVSQYTNCTYGKAQEVLNENNLSSLYKLPIARHSMDDQDIIVPRYSSTARPENKS